MRRTSSKCVWIWQRPLLAIVLLVFVFPNALCFAAKPNIIWVVGEDMGPDLGCWGTNVFTPNIDQLAAEGMRFTNVFGTASVCMPNRTAMITGVTQTTLGSVTMRPPKKFQRPLTDGIVPLPSLLNAEAGYTCGNVKDGGIGSSGKDDWNFRFDETAWNTDKLDELVSHQPFYAQFNFSMAHRPFRRDKAHPVDPSKVDLPPYYPDHPVMRRAWADYLESIQHLDRNVGRVLAWLKENELESNTIVFFLSDHGEAFLRGKYFLYDCSLNQPLVIRWPEDCNPPAGFLPGSSSDALVAGTDITAQTVMAAGLQVPDWMHGRPFLGDSPPRQEVFSAADWIGGNQLKSRSVRDKRFKYIRNFNTELSVCSASTEYRKRMHPAFHLINILHERGELTDLHERILYQNLPDEELYDLQSDPHELTNLATDPTYAETKERLQKRLERWIRDSGDLGFEPLSEAHVKHFETYRQKQRAQLTRQREALHQKVLEAVEKHARLDD